MEQTLSPRPCPPTSVSHQLTQATEPTPYIRGQPALWDNVLQSFLRPTCTLPSRSRSSWAFHPALPCLPHSLLLRTPPVPSNKSFKPGCPFQAVLDRWNQTKLRQTSSLTTIHPGTHYHSYIALIFYRGPITILNKFFFLFVYSLFLPAACKLHEGRNFFVHYYIPNLQDYLVHCNYLMNVHC